MAHKCWRFGIMAASEALTDTSTIDEILGPAVTETAERTRFDPARREQLALAGLEPSDVELWDTILTPSADDYGRERAVAARLMLVLIDQSVSAGGLRESAFIVEETLKAMGWSEERRRLAIYGVHLEGFFENQTPWLAAVARECRHWLQGGWLDEGVAAILEDQISRDETEIDEAIPSVASSLAGPTYTTEADISRRAKKGLQRLRQMLLTADRDVALWIIQD